MSEYIRQYRQSRRAWGREKLGGECARCGETQDLEFDHIEPATKVKAIASMLTSSWKSFVAELEKCQLLCRTHHLEKSKAAYAGRRKWTHGKETMYRNGCRCDPCVVSQQERRRRYRKRT